MLFSKYRVDIYTRQTIKKWNNAVCLQAINALFKVTVTSNNCSKIQCGNQSIYTLNYKSHAKRANQSNADKISDEN